LLHSAFSSYHYYDEIELQISSIVRGICKNHPFTDGNKRTAIMTFLVLTEQCNVQKFEKSPDKLFDSIIDIASNNCSVEQISKILF
jgi:death-on-curing protein